MLKDLVEFATKNQRDMLPAGYRNMEPVQWILEVGLDGASRMMQVEIDKPRPSRNRAAGIDPLLLADTAQYVLGLGEGKQVDRALEAKKAFWELLAEAERDTHHPSLHGLSVAPDKFPPAGVENVKPKDVVLVRKKDGGIPFEEPSVQKFWKTYLERQMTAENPAQCGSCGQEKPILRILPTGVKGFPQDVKLASFNLDAFESYGLEQGLNAPLCFDCGSKASAALSHLMESKRHRMKLVRGDGMADQVALFWLKDDAIQTTDGKEVDFSGLFHLVNEGRLPEDEDTKERPKASIGDAEGLLKTPWKLRSGAALDLDQDAFHLAVLSANVSRLVVRDWLHGSLQDIQERMREYLEATKLVDGWGQEVRGQPVQVILEAIGAYRVDKDRKVWEKDPPQADLARALLAAIYLGQRAPRALSVKAVRVLRNPNAWAVDRLVQILLSAIKLERTLNGDNPMTPTERLDTSNTNLAYHTGRLFAVLERAQGAASNWTVNATIVERSYGAASTAPRTTFPPLVRLATTAHLPKAGYLNPIMEEVMTHIKEGGGLPKTFNLQAQADFALGFYHQRAQFRAESKARQEAKAEKTKEEST